MQSMLMIALSVATLVLVLGCAQTSAASAKPSLTLAREGKSDYVIVTAQSPSPGDKRAAAELQKYLKEMTGATLPIVPDSTAPAAHEIVLGDNARLKSLQAKIDPAKLGKEGYTIATLGERLIIAGGEPRGTMYGVYGLLEDHLGCRWFTPEVTVIPSKPTLTLEAINETVVPPLEYRDVYVYDCFDADWSARNRVNGSGQLDEDFGGRVSFGQGLFCHTVFTLLPPEKYFKDHPEYFAMVNGKRTSDSEICYTNDDAIAIMIDALRDRMRKDPTAMVYSVSHMDTWTGYCECDKCKALSEKEGSQAACVLYLVNKLAQSIEKEFPDKAIETLAYTWSRKPPKTMHPRPNVIIRLCSIECCFSHPLEQCAEKSNTTYVDDLKGWAKVCDRLWVWNYETNFHHYNLPFPNYHVWAPNIRFYTANHVKGLFTQDNYQGPNGEFNGLSGYVRAKLLWNPNYDVEKATNEFVNGVYGPAGKYIRQYMDLLSQKVMKENIHVRIYDEANWVYLSDDVLAKAEKLWDQAQAAVANDPARLQCVKIDRLSLDYAQIERARKIGGFASQQVDQKTLVTSPNPALADRVKRFRELGKTAGITTLMEGALSVDDFCDRALAKPQTLSLREADPDKDYLVPGLTYAIFAGKVKKIDELATQTIASSGHTDALDFKVAGKAEDSAIMFTGFVRVPADGVYAFYLSGAGSTRLDIDSKRVADNDNPLGVQEIGGLVALKAGLHAVCVVYLPHTADRALQLQYEGPELHKQPVPATAYKRPKREM